MVVIEDPRWQYKFHEMVAIDTLPYPTMLCKSFLKTGETLFPQELKKECFKLIVHYLQKMLKQVSVSNKNGAI